MSRMDYEEIRQKEGTWIAINQALIDCIKGRITGGDFMDILNDLHPIDLNNDNAKQPEQPPLSKCCNKPMKMMRYCTACQEWEGIKSTERNKHDL